MALASAGAIRLVGITTSSSITPFNPYVTSDDYERFVSQRMEGIQAARQSGFKNIPDPVRGTKGHLQKPRSGRIDDTEPMESEGSRLIIQAAKVAEPSKPLVIVMGAGLTAVANAYLLNRMIAEKVVVAWLGGRRNDMRDYNGWSDPWAAYIALCRLMLVQFPAWQADPEVPKRKLVEFPPSDFRQWMIEKRHPNGSPGGRDVDAPPAIA
jgi:inosine-uridine nucleoside N-ribohydrolase